MKPNRRAGSGRLRGPMVASVLAHALLVGALWVMATSAEPPPRMRVYAVDIVSPPPQLAGEFNPGGGGEPVAVEEAPEPAVEPEPAPPAPAPPVEAPPKKEPAPVKKEPSPPAKATSRPEPAKPAPKGAEPKSAQSKPAPPKPAAEKPKQTAGGGTGDGSGASRGANPDAASPGGEGLDVRLRGVQCPSPAYCGNIVRQLNRYFRPPANASGDVAEVFFRINRDGSVSDIRVVRNTGSVTFRLAAMEAVEQAGINKAFGALPREFQTDQLPVSFSFRPAR